MRTNWTESKRASKAASNNLKEAVNDVSNVNVTASKISNSAVNETANRNANKSVIKIKNVSTDKSSTSEAGLSPSRWKIINTMPGPVVKPSPPEIAIATQQEKSTFKRQIVKRYRG